MSDESAVPTMLDADRIVFWGTMLLCLLATVV
jgi:hypothetical protein